MGERASREIGEEVRGEGRSSIELEGSNGGNGKAGKREERGEGLGELGELEKALRGGLIYWRVLRAETGYGKQGT